MYQRAAAGGLLRDEDGRVIKAYQVAFGSSSVLYAELLGIWQGLKWCCDLHIDGIIVEADSQVALSLIQKDTRNWHWSVSILLSKILNICKTRTVTFVHIYREGNAAADWLASDALKHNRSMIYEPGDVPIPVRRIAYSDKHGIPYLMKTKG